MDSIVIQGGTRLNGTIPVSGAKNSALAVDSLPPREVVMVPPTDLSLRPSMITGKESTAGYPAVYSALVPRQGGNASGV